MITPTAHFRAKVISKGKRLFGIGVGISLFPPFDAYTHDTLKSGTGKFDNRERDKSEHRRRHIVLGWKRLLEKNQRHWRRVGALGVIERVCGEEGLLLHP